MASPKRVRVGDLINQRFGGDLITREFTVLVSPGVAVLITPNPNRLYLYFQNERNYPARILDRPDVSSVNGWYLNAQGGVIAIAWDEDGDAVFRAYWGYGIGGDTYIRVREVSLQ